VRHMTTTAPAPATRSRRATTPACVLAFAALVTTFGGRAIGAREPKPLPEFTVIDMESRAVSSADLVAADNWVLIYLQPACAPCATLLQMIDPDQQPDVTARTVIVVGGLDERAVATAAAAFPRLARARWFADPGKSLAAALPAPAAPVLLGLRRDRIVWSVAGIVPNATAVKSAVFTWIGN
jgi:hypothetical protein